MRILVHGINYAPELTGIGKYTSEMVEWLCTHGHDVCVITAPPYYPAWRIGEGYSFWSYRRETNLADDLVIYRCPLWVPARPTGMKRLIHLASFALSSLPLMLRQVFWKPDVVILIEPTLMCAPAALLVAKLCGAKAWLHVQDFEADAAFELGILRSHRLRNAVLFCERLLMRSFDKVSTISPNMLARLMHKGVEPDRAVLFPNWVDAQTIFPLDKPSSLREELGLGNSIVVALYSGNMGEKQGLEVILETAKQLANEERICFVLCGDGAARHRLQNTYSYLRNVRWISLQPAEKLNDLLNLADIHLLPQRADVADLVMPSKLLGMLASGRPILATAYPGTQLAKVVSSCGKVVAPGDAGEIVKALLELLHAPEERKQLGLAARRAMQVWDKSKVLHDFEGWLRVAGVITVD